MGNNNGKKKCDLLKSVRKRIAEENGIPYEPTLCSYTGECKGTCPKCEAELRYLDRELSVRKRMGNSVKIVGLATGLAAMTACTWGSRTTSDIPSSGVPSIAEDPGEIVMGDVPDPDSQDYSQAYSHDTVRVTTVVSGGDSTSFVVPSGDTEKGDPWNCHKKE